MRQQRIRRCFKKGFNLTTTIRGTGPYELFVCARSAQRHGSFVEGDFLLM